MRVPLLTALAFTAAHAAGSPASGDGFAQAQGGGESSIVFVNEAGSDYDSTQREALVRFQSADAAGKAQAGCRVNADVDAGLLGLSAGTLARVGGSGGDAQARATNTFSTVYRLVSPTLADGTPITVDVRVTLSVAGNVWHTNGPIGAPERSRTSGYMTALARTLRAVSQTYSETATMLRESWHEEDAHSGSFNGQSMPDASLFQIGTRNITLDGVVGGTLQLEFLYESRSSTLVRFSDQRGRATFCGSLGFGVSVSGDVELEPTDPMLPGTPPGVEVITPGYVEENIPPDPLKDCPGDADCDGSTDFFDVLTFLALFDLGDPRADWDNNGEFDFFDVLGFLAEFAIPCDPVLIPT